MILLLPPYQRQIMPFCPRSLRIWPRSLFWISSDGYLDWQPWIQHKDAGTSSLAAPSIRSELVRWSDPKHHHFLNSPFQLLTHLNLPLGLDLGRRGVLGQSQYVFIRCQFITAFMSCTYHYLESRPITEIWPNIYSYRISYELDIIVLNLIFFCRVKTLVRHGNARC